MKMITPLTTPRRAPALLGPVLIAGALAIVFWSALKPGWTLFSNDGPLGLISSETYALPQAWTGGWHDLNTLGYQHGGAFPSLTYALLYVLGPVQFSKLYAALTLLILGIGAFTFFRKLKLSLVACCLGGLAASLNSAFLSAAAWGVGTHPLALGFCFLGLAAVVGNSGKNQWLKAALGGLCVGLGVMEGADVGAIFSLVVAAFILWQAWFGSTVLKERLALGIGRLSLVAVFAGFMAFHAINVLVGTQVKGIAGAQQDSRSKEQRWDWATQWSLPKKETLGLLVPGLFGYRMDTPDGGNYWGGAGREPAIDRWLDGGRKGEQPGGFMRFTGGGNYSGILVVLAGVWAVCQGFRRKDSVFSEDSRRWIWFWSIVLLASLLLAFGRFAPFYQLLYLLPYFSTIRNPAKFIHVFNWALVVLFAYGVNGIWQYYVAQPDSGKGPAEGLGDWFKKVKGFDRRWALGMLALVGVSGLAWLMFSSSNRQFEDYLMGVQFDAPTAAAIARFSSGQVGWFLLFLTVAVALLLMVFSGRFRGPRSKWAAILLGTFLVVDLGRADRPWIITWDYPQKYATNPVIDRLREKAYEQRVALLPGWMHQVLRAPPELGMLDQLYRIEWAQHLFYYYDIQSLDIVQLPRMPEDLQAFETALQPKNMTELPHLLTRRWQLTNTRYLLGPADFVPFLNQQIDPGQQRFRIAERFNIVGKAGIAQPTKLEELTAAPSTNGSFALIEFTGALPRAKLYPRWQVQTNAESALKELASPGFNPATNVLISTAVAAAPVGGATNDTAGTVEFASYAPRHIVVKAKAATPSVLLLNDRYDPSWKVTVDGKPETLFRANYLMRGVYLPAGEHTVEFRFSPPTGSLYVSLSAWAAGLLLLVGMRFAREEHPVTASA